MSLASWLNLPWLESEKGEVKKEKIHWGQLTGAALSLSIAEQAKQAPGLTILITPDTPSALKLESELEYLTLNTSTQVLVFPDWETLPYDHFSPHQDIISTRLKSLYRLRQINDAILIVPVTTLMLKTPPPEYIYGASLSVKVSDIVDIHQLRTNLEQAGYTCVQQVYAHGEYAIRGAILDLFPMGSERPFRLDFLDDELDTIRTFDPETQRSDEKLDQIELLPAREFPTQATDVERFRIQYREQFGASSEQDSVYMQVSKGAMPPGVEYYFPLFFEHISHFFEYLPPACRCMLLGDIEDAASQYWQDVSQRYENRKVDPLRPLLAPEQLYLRVPELFEQLNQFPKVFLNKDKIRQTAGRVNLNAHTPSDIRVDHQKPEPFAALKALLNRYQNSQIIFSVESAGRRESLLQLLHSNKIKTANLSHLNQLDSNSKQAFAVIISPLEQSVIVQHEDKKAPALVLITEQELLGAKVAQSRRRKQANEVSPDAIIRNLAELSQGQPIVHLEHGVGRYQGLQTLDTQGMATEFVTIEYANDAKLYVPVASLHLLSRYSAGESTSAPLHKLGSDTWEKAKRKAAEKVRDVAAELLDIYAKRQAKPGFAYKIDEQSYVQFADSFPFEETQDQQAAIANVLKDMSKAEAMDRLVCGDVGFGKTEVAMRAAFVAINDAKQVAVLVPTTLLAQQHYENFKDRFANLPVEVEVLSRFKSTKEQNQVLSKLEEGKVDIVIGTHKLLQQNIRFEDLGLLIVDEEHRFGVRQKERIKSLRANVDILTLTATPIPRTLNMAMSGMRDLSIIATPPAKRLAVKTFVRQRDAQLIREAILREIKRGGQVYFLHNNVETINRVQEEINEWVPEASVTIAHGQMRERELEQVMSDFYHQKYNVLVCTTIIETGIDVPTANTIIMDRADKLGLAQLHQLRGRVGRSHHQAYAYLMTPPPKAMTKDAAKRLDAIASLEDLGAGFTLATHDLEIRGAGELLGDEQSGQIEGVGFSLYMDMLEQAVESLKSGKEPSLDNLLLNQTEVDVKASALFPEDYIHDVNTRLSLYKRVASCEDSQAIDELKIELIDRFGLLPEPAKTLFAVQQLKVDASQLGIKKIEATSKGGYIDFGTNSQIDPSFIIGLMQSAPHIYKMDGPTKFKFAIAEEKLDKRLQLVASMIQELSSKGSLK